MVIFNPSLLGTFCKFAKIQKFMDDAERPYVIKLKTERRFEFAVRRI
jgi:hypothetical protein